MIDRNLSDLLKLIAALGVMLSHYFNIKAASGASLNPLEWIIRSQGGNVSVAIFFFLSGYGLMMSELKSHLGFGAFLRKRFCKIYLPVLLVTVIWLPLYYSLPDKYIIGGGNLLIVRDLLISFQDPVLWFVRSLIMLYAAFYAFSALLGRNKPLAILTLWLLTVATCVVTYFTNGSFGINAISGVPLFSVGVMAALYSEKYVARINIAIIPLTLSFVAISLTLYCHQRFFENLVHTAADYAAVGTILLFASHLNLRIKIPAIVAAITFDLYLVHFKVLTLIKSYDAPLNLPLFLIATVLAATGFYLLRRKIIKI